LIIKIWQLELIGPKLKQLKNIDLLKLNIPINLNDIENYRNLISIDSADNIFIINKNRVDFIHVETEISVEFYSNENKNLDNPEMLEIWNASHSSILIGILIYFLKLFLCLFIYLFYV